MHCCDCRYAAQTLARNREFFVHIQAHACALGPQLHAVEGQARGSDAYHVGQPSSAGNVWEVGGSPCTEQAFYRADLQQWQS